MKVFSKSWFALPFLLVLTSCGGSSSSNSSSSAPTLPTYTGATGAVTISSSNVEKLTLDASAAMKPVVDNATQSDSGVIFPYTKPNGSPAGMSTFKQTLAAIGKRVAQDFGGNLPASGLTYSSNQLNTDAGMNYYCGGSVTIPDNSPGPNDTSGSFAITFSNLCFDLTAVGGTGQWTMNGTMSIQWDDSVASETVSFINFTVYEKNNVLIASMNASETCTWDPVTSTNYSCASTLFFAAGDGKVHKIVSTSTASGDATNGWNFTVTYYDPDYGSVNIAATNLLYACNNGHPSSGTIVVSDGNGNSAEITFGNCNTYNATYTLAGGTPTRFSTSIW